RARSGEVHGPSRADQYAPAGADPDERPDLRRGGPRPGAARVARRRQGRQKPSHLRVPAGDGAHADGHGSGRPGRSAQGAADGVRRGSTIGRQAPRRRRLRAQQPAGRRGAGRVDDGGQRDSQSGRDHHQTMNDLRTSHLAPHASDLDLHLTRRQLFGLAARGIGAAALGALLRDDLFAMAAGQLQGVPHFAPKAKRVIFLHQSGGPSQLETFDYKPALAKFQGTQIPDSVRQGQRVAQTMGQSALLVTKSQFEFSQHGQSGTWVSELLPHTAKIVDDITVIKTMNQDAIKHDPAITFIQTGFQQPGRPSMGAWLSYGLGSENQNLPGFVVLLSQANAITADQPLFSRLWGSGFLPSAYQGVRFRAGSSPVLYLEDPPGVSKPTRRAMLDAVKKLNA